MAPRIAAAGGVGDGLLADAPAFAPVAAEQDRGRVAPVRDRVDSAVHGNRLPQADSLYNPGTRISCSKLSWECYGRSESARSGEKTFLNNILRVIQAA